MSVINKIDCVNFYSQKNTTTLGSNPKRKIFQIFLRCIEKKWPKKLRLISERLKIHSAISDAKYS